MRTRRREEREERREEDLKNQPFSLTSFVFLRVCLRAFRAIAALTPESTVAPDRARLFSRSSG